MYNIIFKQKLLVQDNFRKNKVTCAFATTDNRLTLCFVISGRPKSLLKGNELAKSMQKEVDLIFRRLRGSNMPYDELVYGNVQNVSRYKNYIKDYVSNDFFNCYNCNEVV